MPPESRRPDNVVQRDHQVAVHLLQGPKSMRDLATELGHDKIANTYRSVWRLRRDGLVDKSTTGSRTPVWQLTEAGVAQATGWTGEVQSVPVPTPEPVAEAPTPEPQVPAPEPVPVPVPEAPAAPPY